MLKIGNQLGLNAVMDSLSRKIALVSVLSLVAVTAVAAFTGPWFTQWVRETGLDWLDIAGTAYDRFRPDNCPVAVSATPKSGQSRAISMSDFTDWPGENIVTKTFALSVADVNGDGKDDILIGAHEYNPYLLVNTGNGFSDESRTLFPQERKTDRHGYSFADLDNDGDLDLAIASGGQNGVGAGAPNLFLRNGTAHGLLQFSQESVDAEMEVPAARSRSLMPVVSADGRAIDLYYTALLRKGFPNHRLVNARRPDKFRFEPEPGFYHMATNDHGRGVIADFDGDGKDDYLAVENWILKLYWHPDSGKGISRLSYKAYSTTVADFNNDGLLDIFAGAFSKPSRSDNISYSSRELIYTLTKNGANDISAITFKSASDDVELNLNQHNPNTKQKPSVAAHDIFLGGRQVNPQSRIFTLSKQQASGEPENFTQPGIYIWYATSSQEWNIRWIFHDTLDEFKGWVKGEGISDMVKINFTVNESQPVTDAIFINQGNGDFSQLCTGLAAHWGATSDSAVADFNNDGWLDIIGLRQGEEGAPNGEIFVLTNDAGTAFSSGAISLREKDKLQRSDLIAYGFFDGDEKPDIVLTNGYGQIPGNEGSPRLMLNSTATNQQALLINLAGTSANSFGIGAELTLTDANNEIIGYRVQGLNSNISQDTHWMHFGLGDYRKPYTLTVDWPDGIVTSHAFTAPGVYRVTQ